MPVRPPYHDEDRVAALCALNILDTPPDNTFDRLTRLAAATLQMPIALVSLVDRDRQWFKSAVGLDAPQTGRDVAFCSHAVEQGTLLEVPDALLDPRFATNPLVTGPPDIRFYAGHPIFSPDGHAIGTLCVIDRKPRTLSADQRALLADLAEMAQEEMHKSVIQAARERAERALHELNLELENHVRQRTADLAIKNHALVREIKQRQQVEATLRQNEERIQAIIDSSFNAFVGMDEDGRIVDWNPAAQQLFGWSRDDALGRDFSVILIARQHRDTFDHRLQLFLDTAGADNKLRTELRMINCQGEELMVEVAINIFTIGGKRFLGGLIHDISERTAARQALEQKQQLLDAILESVDVGVVACDAAGELTLFNRAARLYHGADAEAVDCSAWASRYSLYAADGETALSKEAIPLFRALRGERVTDVEMVIAPDNLKRRTLLASGRPLLSSVGEPLGAVVAMKDISDLAESQSRLAEEQRRLRLITDHLPSLIGLVDADGKLAFVNSRAERFYQKTAAELVGQPARILYSDAEYALVKDHIAAALRGERVTFEAQAVYKGQPYHYHACYVPNLDDAGQPNGFFAMAFDITERKHSELRQAESEERLRLVTNNLPALISHLDRDLRYTFANARHLEWKGKDPAAMIGCSVQDVFGKDYYETRKDAYLRCLDGTTCEFENVALHEGKQRSMTSNYIPHISNGEVIGIYVLSVDTTAAHLHQYELSQLAHTDVMTGLPNRRHYEERLADTLLRASRANSPLALLFLDIDHFKRINDTLGHAAGDEVLKEFGSRLLASVRQSDSVARLAGDEFTIILENVASAQIAAQVAAKIVTSMQAPFQVDGQAIHVTTSIGVAWSARPCEVEMGKLADSALYRSKQAGRNTYSVADEPTLLLASTVMAEIMNAA